MKTPLLASLVAAGVLAASGAQAISYPGPNQCSLYSTDLRQDLKLVTAWHPNYDSAAETLQMALVKCQSDEQDEAVAMMKAAIESLGLPVMTYN